MHTVDIYALSQQILFASFAIGLLFGALAQKTHFCTMGAISDVINMGDWTRALQWMMAIGVSMMGFAMLSLLGYIKPEKAVYSSTQFLWLSSLVGGVLFGLGMVFASGCGNKTLIRVGTGNLKSWVVMIVIGISGFATLKGITAVMRVATVDQVLIEMPQGANLATFFLSLFAPEHLQLTSYVGLSLGFILFLYAALNASFFKFENWMAGLGIGLLVIAAWWVSGNLGHLLEHPETLEEVYLKTNSTRMEALSFVAPIAYLFDWLEFYSDKSKTLSIGIVTVVGVICGSFVTSKFEGSFRWEGFGSVEDLGNHLIGAVLMGVGGVTAMGCTIGQGVSGLSTLSLNAVVATLGIVIGAVTAIQYQTWRLD
jgi:uncharacterized membrane protein YedE/YeeE